MLKKKFAIITLIIILILSLTLPVVKAEDGDENTTTENVEIQLPTGEESNEIEESSNESEDLEMVDMNNSSNGIEKKDIYIMDPGDVVVDYAVDGNLFVIANSVTISSQIGGDAFICANTVTIDSQGYVFSNLFTCCNELNISGVLYDLYNCSQKTSIDGYIYRDIHSATNSLDLSGIIGRNAYISTENINFATYENETDKNETESTNSTMIYGELHLESSNKIDVPDEVVSGTIFYTNSSTESDYSTVILNYIWDLGTFIATVLVIWLLILWLAPKFLEKTEYLVSKKVLPSLGLGVLTTIVMIASAILLLVIGITSKVALLGVGLLMLLLGIGLPIFTISISKFICKKLNNEKTLVTLGILILSSIVIWLTTLIPFVGGIINLVIKFIGLGIIVKYVLPSRKKEDNNVETIKTDE